MKPTSQLNIPVPVPAPAHGSPEHIEELLGYEALPQSHPYHLVTPSPWPLLTSFALLILTSSAVIWFNGYATPFGANGSSILLTLGFLSTLGAMILWFRDVVTEGTFLGDHTYVVQKGIMISFGLFVVSEIFVFISIFWAFFHSSLSPTVELGAQWPAPGIPVINAFELPLLNTVLLLSSGATVTYGHHAHIKGDRKGAIVGTFLTVVLAIIFTICQGIEYHNAGFSMSDSVYGSAFYAATGTHGLHVLVGTIFIGVGLFRMISYHITDSHHLGYEAGILYWHFVDIVWLFLFISVYWWGSL